MDEEKRLSELEAKIAALEELEKKRADEAEKAMRDEKYRLSMLGHENNRWDFSDAMYLLPTDPNNNDIRLQQAAKNFFLMIDRWGIHPDFIKCFPNVINNNSFEWYDPVTKKPLFWQGDGVVTDWAAYDGTYSLKLMPGETHEQGYLDPIYPGLEAGSDPAWWNNYQTRGSFRQKGGAVRVKIKTYSGFEEGEVLADPVDWTTWRQFANKGYGNICETSDGRAICAYVEANNVRVAFAPTIAGILNGTETFNYDGATTIKASETTADFQVSVNLIDGQLHMAISQESPKPIKAEYWRDSDGRGLDFQKVSDITINNGPESGSRTRRIPITTIHKLGNGNLVVVVPRVYVSLVTRDSCTAHFSTNGGATWAGGATIALGLGDHLGNNFSKTLCVIGDSEFFGYWMSSSSSDWIAHWTNSGASYTRRNSNYETGTGAAIIVGKGESRKAYMARCATVAGLFQIYELNAEFDVDAITSYMTLANFTHLKDFSLGVGYYNVGMLQTSSTLISFTVDTYPKTIQIRGAGTEITIPDPYILTDNSEEGLIDKYGQEVGIVRSGYYLDYPYIENWAQFIEGEQDLSEEAVKYLVTGYRTFYFQPKVGKGKVKFHFENIDPTNPVYIDMVQMAPDFTGKWGMFETLGKRSIAPGDILGMPGLGGIQENPVTGELELTPNPHAVSHATGESDELTPNPHASSHATGGSDELTPADIGAAEEVHVHDNLKIHQTVEVMSRGGLELKVPIKTVAGTAMGWKMAKDTEFYISDRIYIIVA